MQSWLMLPKYGLKTLNNREKPSGIKSRYCVGYRFNIVTHMNFPQTSGKEKLSSAEKEAKEAETQGRADLEGKYESVKGSGKDTLTRARDSTEKLYNEARQKADDVEKKVDHGWSSWFNWGKSKADDIESEAEKGKHD